MTGNATWREVLKENRQRYLDEMVELLRIPSVSASDDHIDDVKRAAQWVADRLKKGGFENVEICPTGVHDAVYADWMHAPGMPTVLIYGHFDVQPADPLELWDSPPFEPVIKDGRIYARGTADMKSNLILCLTGVEALLQSEGKLPVNVKFLFEGQEEIGSRDLPAFVAANREKLACDIVLTPDGIQWNEEQPCLCMGFKGLCAMEVEVETAGMDMHSGLYGGAVPNAAHALVQLLGSLRDAEGNILVEGFYDSVRPLTAGEREKINEVPFDADTYKREIGVTALVGEPGYSTYERAWARPTLDVNGLWGGYSGGGVKTVIPAKAGAKITCRLVANQVPEKIVDCIEAHMKKHCPAGATLRFKRFGASANPYEMPSDNVGVQAVAEVLTEVYGRAPYFVKMGGSLPITDMFRQELGAYTVDVGFALDDERMHSPNEFMRLGDFDRGQVVYVKMLERLARLAPGSMG
ncbi:MAG: dipeptidase [Armatimonadetes bacterium]|nr:dipeptidase [Armatimonadota bacterium]